MPPVDSSRRKWLKAVGLGAGATALAACVDSGVKELNAAGMKTEHFPSATPNLNDGLIRLSSKWIRSPEADRVVEIAESDLMSPTLRVS